MPVLAAKQTDKIYHTELKLEYEYLSGKSVIIFNLDNTEMKISQYKSMAEQHAIFC